MPPWSNMKLYDLYKKTYTPWEWHSKLKQSADDLGMDFFFHHHLITTAVDFLGEPQCAML